MDLHKLSKKELLEICKNKEFFNYKSKTKNELIEMIERCSSIHLKPLIKWSGGKSDEIKTFEKYFPENYETYIEPFIGGGSVYFYLNPKKAVINDIHKELIDFYMSISNGKNKDIYEDFTS